MASLASPPYAAAPKHGWPRLDAADHALEVKTLGLFAARSYERLLPKLPIRPYRLLTFLLCSPNHERRTDEIAEQLWPDDPRGHNNLHQAARDLRTWLGMGSHFVSEASTYAFRGCLVDADLFEGHILTAGSLRRSDPDACAHELREARRLYGGEFLPLDVSEWVVLRRAKLQGCILDTCVFLAATEIEHRDYTAAHELAAQALSVDTLREDAVRLKLEALAGLGRRTEARRYFQQFAQLLRKELACVPDPNTTATAMTLGLA